MCSNIFQCFWWFPVLDCYVISCFSDPDLKHFLLNLWSRVLLQYITPSHMFLFTSFTCDLLGLSLVSLLCFWLLCDVTSYAALLMFYPTCTSTRGYPHDKWSAWFEGTLDRIVFLRYDGMTWLTTHGVERHMQRRDKNGVMASQYYLDFLLGVSSKSSTDFRFPLGVRVPSAAEEG